MIGRYVYVICNGCGEPCGPDLFVYADDARAAARLEGWRYRKTRPAVGPDEEPIPGGDYCPTCTANIDKGDCAMFIVIDTEGALTRRDGRASAAAIREVVGEPGFAIVRIYTEQRDLSGFVNDEGFRLGLARNPVGACVLASLGANAQVYAGPIVITGWDRYANGPEITDLTPEQADLIEQLHGFTRQALDGADVRFVGAENWSGDMRDYAEFVSNADAPVLTVRSLDEVG